MIFGNALSDAARRAAAKNEILSHKNANFGRRTEAKNEILRHKNAILALDLAFHSHF